MPEKIFTKVFTFNSARKSMSTIVPMEGGGYRVYTKGASEIIMKMCSFLVGEGGKVESFSSAQQDRVVQTVIEPMAKEGLRTISVAYRDFVPGRAERNQVHYDLGNGFYLYNNFNSNNIVPNLIQNLVSTNLSAFGNSQQG